jgi:two-component system sensor histidine kinase/response regulator
MMTSNNSLCENNSKTKNGTIKESIKSFSQCTGIEIEDVKEIFDEFVVMLPKMLQDMKYAISTSDFEELKGLAHQLKGSSGNLMFTSIYEIVKAIEKEAVNKDSMNCLVLIRELEECYNGF